MIEGYNANTISMPFEGPYFIGQLAGIDPLYFCYTNIEIIAGFRLALNLYPQAIHELILRCWQNKIQSQLFSRCSREISCTFDTFKVT